MSKATWNLEDDHVQILKLIEVMEHITLMDDPDIGHLEKIVEIIKNFADGVHHAKEENIFFPLLSRKGFPSNQGPVAVMLNEHVQGRKFVRGIEENLRLYKSGTRAALSDVYQNMKSYNELLRNHISKENNVLFRMADNVLTETDDLDLMGRFEDAERKHSKTSDYIKSIQDLTSFYKI